MLTNSTILIKANEWFAKGLTLQQIQEELLQNGMEPRHLPEMMAEIKKLRNARKTSKGLVWILAGAGLCLFSCVLTLMSVGNPLIVLYGFTTIGIISVFVGLVQILD